MKSRWMPGYSALQLIVVLVVLLLLFAASSLLSPYFATPYNMTIIARSLAFTGLVTLGQAMLMLLGELDISLGAMGGLCGVAAGMLMMDLGVNPFAAMGLAIALGGTFLVLAWRVFRVRSGEKADRHAMMLFGFSIIYLFLLFADLVVERVLALAGMVG